jgi:hypothetical protein
MSSNGNDAPLFLDDAELVALTGRKLKSKQVEWLRHNGIAFRVNATGHPVVTRSAVESRETTTPAPIRGWTPRVIGA